MGFAALTFRYIFFLRDDFKLLLDKGFWKMLTLTLANMLAPGDFAVGSFLRNWVGMGDGHCRVGSVLASGRALMCWET